MMLPLLSAVLSAALAQDAVSLAVVRTAQVGGPPPRLTLTANQGLSLDVALRCGSLAPITASQRLDAGRTLDLDIPLTAPGQATCKGSLSVKMADGATGELPLSFAVEVLPGMAITVAPADVDLAGRTVTARFDREVSRAEIEAFGLEGSLGGSGAFGPYAAGTPVALSWASTDEVLRLTVRGQDTGGFWAALDLLPWSYNIPHEDVVFASNQAAIAPTEAPRLQAAMRDIDAVVAKYGAVAELNLYVAGYTDTVGGAAGNRTLSEQRARAIATWFRAAGFSGPIFYQGFGEGGLLVATPDETDEPRNRRAAYIIAAEAPPPSDLLPGTTWRRL